MVSNVDNLAAGTYCVKVSKQRDNKMRLKHLYAEKNYDCSSSGNDYENIASNTSSWSKKIKGSSVRLTKVTGVFFFNLEHHFPLCTFLLRAMFLSIFRCQFFIP